MTARSAVTAALIALAASTALASDDCNIPMANWQPREAVRAMVEARGWRLDRIKIDDGCYEVHVTDAEGKRFEAMIDPATLEILEIEVSHHHR
ncbi:MAG: PepSY domain-containing protein [Hydrogenophaga sp.]|nr:PepSY domain-containing protein [Hydrogenophaga sp.]